MPALEFLNLPYEIRRCIYQEIFTNLRVTLPDTIRLSRPIEKHGDISVLFAYKSIYEEARPIFLSSALFCTPINLDPRKGEDSRRTPASTLNQIRRVTVRPGLWESAFFREEVDFMRVLLKGKSEVRVKIIWWPQRLDQYTTKSIARMLSRIESFLSLPDSSKSDKVYTRAERIARLTSTLSLDRDPSFDQFVIDSRTPSSFPDEKGSYQDDGSVLTSTAPPAQSSSGQLTQRSPSIC